MDPKKELTSLALLTDLYQLTMASGYLKSGTHEQQCVFHLFFRTLPFDGGYAVACGLQTAIEALQNLCFTESDISYLQSLNGNDGLQLFDHHFLNFLAELTFSCDVDAIPEGTVVFPHEPLLRITGPIIQCQLLETLLLNIINFQTLVATKAARICDAADGDQVLEFGLRRAQGINGGLAASRAAYIGGCAATSNVLAGQQFGIPVKGTHAHSWVMSFLDETTAFEEYANAMPNNCVFLVDTFNTRKGIRNAVKVALRLRADGHEMVGIRLDSGDLAALSIEARKMLDNAGFPDASIVASNDLDEYAIAELKSRGAKIDVWGVGTKLATAYDQPALGGVYKLAAVRNADSDEWTPKIKLSEDVLKASNPGILQVRRFTDEGKFVADCVYDVESGAEDTNMIDVADATVRHVVPKDVSSADLLVPVIRDGKPVYRLPTIHECRRRTLDELDSLPSANRTLKAAEKYPVGLAGSVYELKMRLMKEAQAGELWQ